MSTTQASLTVTSRVHFAVTRRGRKQLVMGATPTTAAAPASEIRGRTPGRTPRLARLMALAIRFEGLLARGEVRDYAELARLGHVTRGRVTQIMNLLNLAPDIQEAILFLPPVKVGRDPVKEWQMRPIAAEPDWARQRTRWHRLMHGSARGPGLDATATPR